MRSTEELDAIDREILRILAGDGRAAAARLAEQIGISRPAISERMEKLERNGVILGTTVIVDPAALGKNVTAFVSARQSGSFDAKGARAFRDLLRSEDILEVHSVAGEDCYFMKVRTESISSLNDLISKLTASPLNLSTRTTIVMETHLEKVGGIALAGPDDE
ncbi:MAG TPA: Lrp/AsnC family transcriptional regulator [Thermoanaerobaculia bacterium]|nr:Lrp/AsnC family transcriptional regulator [Thermoanaerobaculia bacterium]